MSTNPNTQFQPQGPGAYQSGGLPPQPLPPAGPPSRSRNTVAIVAFAAAVAGFVFAVWEGAYIVGWVLLPVAFVLAIVALVVKDKPRKMAVWALVISVIGTVAGGIAFMGSVGKAIDESFGGSTPTVKASEPAAGTSDAPAEEKTEPAASEAGTRENPHPLGTTIASDEWEVTVNSFTPDATAAVLAENEFNDKPADGSAYSIVNVTLKRVAAEAGTPMEVDVSYVTAGGNVVTIADAFAVAPDALSINELYEGASVTGNVVLMVPVGDAGVLRIRPGMFSDEVFFATS